MMKKHLTLFVFGATLFANTAYISAMDSANPTPANPVPAATSEVKASLFSKIFNKGNFTGAVEYVKGHPKSFGLATAAAVAAYATWKLCPAVREFFGVKETKSRK